MDDIVERLRSYHYEYPKICGEAADEIERLRAITAAAEVARQGRVANWGHPAAAEVGGITPGMFSTPKGYSNHVDLIVKDAVDAAIAATIERCAWTVEIAWPEAAAAIRALKDK